MKYIKQRVFNWAVFQVCFKKQNSTCLAHGGAGGPVAVWSDHTVSLTGQETWSYCVWTQALWTPTHEHIKTSTC